MQRRTVSFLLLFALLVNIAHASLLYTEESCEHTTVCEYVVEIEQQSDCGDLCDMHHMFHLSAIPADYKLPIPALSGNMAIDFIDKRYRHPSPDPDYRPPIYL